MTSRTTSASAMASRDLAMPMRFGLVAGFAQAGGVDEFHGDAVEGDAFGDRFAGGAGGGGDDGAVALDEAVEEGGFAGVGAADDGQA